MGGFVDPFISAPAWPQDIVFAGSSWSDTASSMANSAGAYGGSAPAQDIEFLLRDGPSPAFLNGSNEETVSPVELDDQLARAQLQDGVTHGMNFQVSSALMAGTLGSVLSTHCAMSLSDSAPILCSSNDSSSGSEQSGLPQFLLGEQPVPAPAVWPSTFGRVSSLVGDETSQSFGFGSVTGDDLLQETGTPDEKKYPQLGSLPSAPLQLHDEAEFNTGKLLSFSPGQQTNTNFDNLQISQKEFSGMHHLNLSSLVSGQLSLFNSTGAAHNPKQSHEVSSGKNGVNGSPTPSNAPNGNGISANGTSKPRVRARRGQATDPHSIAERLRREKISDRMKNLQELVPNSNKTDKASMLDEIIDYVKFLQLQVKVLSMSRLGATEAVVPLLTESQSESSGLLPSLRSGRQAGRGGRLAQPEVIQDGSALEQEVAQLMEKNMTSAMQYLQSKGFCLMPVALASAISPAKGGADVDGGAGGGGKDGARKPFGGPKEMKVQSLDG
ncbi:hypothetical protein ACP70R_026802 [Stipagrostis hirtigluma subsp. patula]